MMKEQIQLELDKKVSELRRELFYRDKITNHLLKIHRECVEEVEQKNIERIELETYTRSTGSDGNRFERVVNEISNLFQEFRAIEKKDKENPSLGTIMLSIKN